MKIEKTMHVGQIPVSWRSLSKAAAAYSKDGRDPDWFDWLQTLWTEHEIANLDFLKVNPVTFVIIDYELDDYRSQYGLTRRDASRILSHAGLRKPTTIETFCLAATESSVGKGQGLIFKTSTEHACRRVTATVPIHPEFPKFFYFGRGMGKGSFKRQNYFQPRGENNLYHIDVRRSDMDSGFVRSEAGALDSYQYPLLLGVVKT